MFIFKIVGANLFRIYLNVTEGKEDKAENVSLTEEKA